MALVSPYLKLARPHQWLKNVFVLAPLFFGHRLTDLGAAASALAAMVAFCLAASAVYAFNDRWDLEHDRRHPAKCQRPLPAGQISPAGAVSFALLLLAGAAVLSLAALPWRAMALLAGYVVLNLAYSLKLKHVAILDICCIAVGFVLRVWVGGLAAGVTVSHWLTIMTFLLALFLALSKRRAEILLAPEYSGTRPSISGYNLTFTDLSMVLMAGVVIVSYLMYTLSPEVLHKHGNRTLYLTAGWVVVGLLRYMQVAFVHEETGSPTQVFLRDRFLLLVGLGWLISFVLILYGRRVLPWF